MTHNFKPRMLSLALSTVLGSTSLVALATPAVSLTAVQNLAGASGPGSDVMDPTKANGGDFFLSNSSSTGSTFFHTYGTSGGVNYFGARVSGTGTFFGKTSATYTDSITNTTGTAQLVTFSFHVDSGQIGLSGAGDGYADLLLSLKFGTDVVARDHGRVTYSSSAASCNSNVGGDDVGVLASYLACAAAGNSADGSSGAYTASKLLAVGETLNIQYDIVSEVSGTLSGATTTFCSFGGHQGGVARMKGAAAADVVAIGGAGEPGASGCVDFNAIARSGDPAGFSPFTAGNFGISSVSAVPEPSVLALAGLALAGLALTTRRRKTR